MKLQTDISLAPSAKPIDYHSRILLVGSCFTEHLGDKLNYFKFQNYINPLGILFHPLAITGLLDRVLERRTFTEDDLVFHQERWHCFEAHSSKSNESRAEALTQLNQDLENTYRFLSNASHLFITLGTAWGYRYKESGKLVANCHKLPQKNFSKVLIESGSVVEVFTQVFNKLQRFNPDLHIVFTISPVRHLKDGFVENQLSKAQLISAVHKLIQQDKSLAYFPSYELMMDELRDYRFYKRDLIHPNELAIDYIWERFVSSYLSAPAREVFDQIADIQKALAHRPFNAESEAHKVFLKKLKKKQETLINRLPHLKFD